MCRILPGPRLARLAALRRGGAHFDAPFSQVLLHVLCYAYLYLIRRGQHHAAQLGLRIQQETGRELAWVGSGFRPFDA